MRMRTSQNPMSFYQTAEAWQRDNLNEKMITLESMDGSYLIVGVAYPTCIDLLEEKKFLWVESSVEDGFVIVRKEAKSEDEKEKGGGKEEEREGEEMEKQRITPPPGKKRLKREGAGDEGGKEEKKMAMDYDYQPIAQSQNPTNAGGSPPPKKRRSSKYPNDDDEPQL
jgi:hypothetical protein